MPGRQSTVLKSRIEPARPRTAKRKSRGGLDALAIAETEYPSKPGLPQHRLGVDEDDGPKRKRGLEDDSSSKRRRTADTGSDYSVEEGSDSEGHEWQIGKVDSENDSEIDSDEALGSSDEERFEGFIFRGSSKPHGNKRSNLSRGTDDIDLSENSEGLSEGEGEEDDDDDGLGEDAVDLATAWDMNAEESEEEAAKKKSASKHTDSSDAFSGEDYDESSDESDLSISDDEDESKARGLSKLKKFVSALETDRPEFSKSQSKDSTGLPRGEPSEYGLALSRKLTVADLIPTITDSRLKGSLKNLDSTASTSKNSKFGKLDAPLAKRQQDRIDRAAAYQKSKETLDRWIETVKANRRAEHLSFPLPEPNAPQPARIVDSKPRTDLESTIQNILVESGLAEANGKDAEDRIQELEEKEINKLSIEEIRTRRAELRRARELMFREEIRAKRIKKIKSKSYRRVHRKEREKMELRQREALAAAGIDFEEEDRELQERRRAEARMGAKHKDSKWAKSLQHTGRTAWDEEARLGMAELARREEELRKRIEGKQVRDEEDFLGSSSEDSDDESDEVGDGFGTDDEADRLKKKLRRLEDDGVNDEIASGPHAKLMSLKFMQKAEAARKAANDAEIRRLNRELGEDGSQSETEDAEFGRQKFGKQKTQPTDQSQPPPVSRSEFEDPESDDERHLVTESNENIEAPVVNNKTSQKALMGKPRDLSNHVQYKKQDDVEENPWLSETVKAPKKKRGTTGEITLIDTSKTNGASEKVTDSKQQTKHKLRNTPTGSDDKKDHEGQLEGLIVLQNEDLVRRAFAGDEVLADFDREKLETIEDEGDKVIEDTLPGWGSWTGEGLSRREKKQVKRTFTKVEGIQPEKRRDAKLDRVIINEKRVKKNTKYLASQLPHPFESKQQYERSLRLPIGPEWTTKETFQNATKPRVMIKQGIIRPMQRPAL
ncbi:hypothetical protein VTO42DRAFT_6007 [Malbranchea cinnamomea]